MDYVIYLLVTIRWIHVQYSSQLFHYPMNITKYENIEGNHL